MSDSDVLARYAAQAGERRSLLGPDAERELWDDLGCFGWLRGVRERAVMLELQRKGGDILAIGYGWLEKVAFNPSEGIMLYLPGQQIQICGQNLNHEVRPHTRLFEGITKHRVPWIKESSRAVALKADEQALIIESIRW